MPIFSHYKRSTMMTLPNPKRMPTRPRPEIAFETRIDLVEKDVADIKIDLDECKDIKSKMDVLEERTGQLQKFAEQNRNAIFGANGQPGILTRIQNVENKIDKVSDDVKGFVGDVKKVGYGIMVLVIGVFIELLVQLLLQHGGTLAK